MAPLRQRAHKSVEIVFIAAFVYILIRGLYAHLVERRLRLPILLALVAFAAAGIIQGVLCLRRKRAGDRGLPVGRTKTESLTWAAGGLLFALAMLSLSLWAEGTGLGPRLVMLFGFVFFLTLTILYIARSRAQWRNPAETDAGEPEKGSPTSRE